MDHKLRNAITDYKGTHKLYNPYLLDCYTSLMPPSNSKISMIIFNGILTNKQYYKENSAFFTESEDKRIYNSQPMPLDFILSQCDPSKYERDKEAKQNDIGNLVKRLKSLEEKNIFYIWRAGYPHMYMFFMERDIGVWKEFNSQGVVVPKTLLKIAKQYKHCIDSMMKMLILDGQTTDKDTLLNSFRLFLDKMISKMNPGVSGKIKMWTSGMGIEEYINDVISALEKLDPFEGLNQDENFEKSLPLSVKWALFPKEAPKINKALSQESSLFISKNEDLVKPKAKAIKEESNDPFENLEAPAAKPVVFETIDPFKNCNEFIKYYRDILLVLNSSAKMPPSWAERATAIEILDMLIINHKNNLHFLKSWIGYFYSTKLQSAGVLSPNKTCLQKFKLSYLDFTKVYSEKTVGA